MKKTESKTYKIVGHTNGWRAQRSQLFKGKEDIVIETGLTLKEAQQKLLDFHNEDYDSEGLAFPNWGLCRINNHNTWSNNDGTRGYEYDSQYFKIEEEV